MLKIKKAQRLKRKPSKVKVDFDEQKNTISFDTYATFGLYEGKELTEDELQEILHHDLHSDLQEKVVNYASYSPRTELQIRRYIRKRLKDYEIDAQKLEDEIIEKLKEFKYIDDIEYAKLFVRSRIKSRPKSRYFLFMELCEKGIEKALANEVLDSLMPDSFEMLKKVFEKKYKDDSISFEDKKKIAYLQRKGFGWDDISRLINEKNEQ